ncbi:hypothetical protein DNK59_22060 [Pseudomonas sp. TKO26]|uniref:hypothetical protein n=1 Tax=unclassified Pseudomonas TaxID=196821 RepID=UPI000D8C3471|nr:MULTISPECIES: hypothetical protein [unclassified Pseudomonas]PYY82202.1 hypothetical protein DNK62_22060 [Pseudomonas sp. TKO30]PYY83666.1 hypothetical protein DNK61_21435 [Pseudomonas sp. TKO29]PYY85623.1 hypothetical protein DNK59_22060 [Pseudomonas sp. TKO26]PYY97918.1 hypothetical protein DNK60_22910 [Pseudomonas sp. TKO14]
MQLPQSLQPWSDWLHWLDLELQTVLGDCLRRLHPLLGPLSGRLQGGDPEPDGLGDLHQRGSYERLLASEWLLAEELPEEFLRRAVSAEHLFVAPQYRTHQASGTLIALFDAGPLQLGAPRLVHLALMIILAQRARAAGAAFRWGVLQDADNQLYELETAVQLRHLLGQRTFQCVEPEHGQRWSEWLSAQSEPWAECWAIGQRLPIDDMGLAGRYQVQVQQSLDGGSLEVEISGARRARTCLPIPPVNVGLRMLKGEFQAPAAVEGRSAIAAPRVLLTLAPVISDAGTHIAMVLLDQPGSLILRLPSAAHKRPPTIHQQLWKSSGRPLAMSFVGRKAGALLRYDDRLSFWNVGGLPDVLCPGPEVLKLPSGTATLLACAWLRDENHGRYFVLDSQGRLARWSVLRHASPDEPPGTCLLLADHVLGLSKVDSQTLVYVREEAGQLLARTACAGGEIRQTYRLGAAAGVTQILVAAGGHWQKDFGACALLTPGAAGERWQLLTRSGSQELRLAPGWRGFGLWHDPVREGNSLVLLGPDRRTVALYHSGEQRVLFSCSDEVVKSSFCSISGLIAVLTGTRELLVYSLAQERMRLQIHCNLKPSEELSHA